MEIIVAAAAYDEESGELNVFVINADLDEAQEFTLDIRGFAGLELTDHIVMRADSPEDMNTFENPNVLLPRSVKENRPEGGILTVNLEKASWNVFRFAPKQG